MVDWFEEEEEEAEGWTRTSRGRAGGRASSSPSTRSTSRTGCCGSRLSPGTMPPGPRAPPARAAHRSPTGRANASGDGRSSDAAKVSEDSRFPPSSSLLLSPSTSREFGVDSELGDGCVCSN